MIRRRILTGVLLAVLFGLGWWVGRSQATSGLYENLDLFVEILHRVEDNYVDVVDSSKLVEGAIDGMVGELDPYSQFLDARTYDMLQSSTQGRFSGIGVVVSVRDGYPTVISPIEGTPAWEAGLRAGDAIIAVDGESTAGFSVQDAADLLRGPEGTKVEVTVQRYGDEESHDYQLERREIVTKSVPYAFVYDGRVGYLRLADFSSQSGEELREAIAQLEHDGAKSLVLDVRSNPGGLLDQAVGVAEQFLPKDALIVYTKGRARGQDRKYYAGETRPHTQWPMVVLIDEGSASASEIVAGALQDRDRALAIGTPSFGKGLVQSVFPLENRSVALKLTTARYYTPSGRSIHREDKIPMGPHAEVDAEIDAESGAGAAPDTLPVYQTLGGRKVLGGGGIIPDVEVEPDSLPPLAVKAERRGWPFRFANTWINEHAKAQESAAITPAIWDAYVAFMHAQDESLDATALERDRQGLERSLRRELARRSGGEAAAARVALERDAQFQRAVAILERARSAKDVFSAAGVDVPRRGGSRMPQDRRVESGATSGSSSN